MSADTPDAIQPPVSLRWLDPDTGVLVGGPEKPDNVRALSDAEVAAHLQAQDDERQQRLDATRADNQTEAKQLYTDLVGLGLPDESAAVLARMRFKDVEL